MHVVDELKDFSDLQHLCFTDFLEAVSRVARCKALPSASDIRKAEVESAAEFMKHRKHRQRLVKQHLAIGGAGSTNTGEQLARRLEILLPLITEPIQSMVQQGNSEDLIAGKGART